MLYSGIDLHKKFSYITTVDGEGSIIKQGKINNTPSEILGYFRSLPSENKSVVETSTGWY